MSAEITLSPAVSPAKVHPLPESKDAQQPQASPMSKKDLQRLARLTMEACQQCIDPIYFEGEMDTELLADMKDEFGSLVQIATHILKEDLSSARGLAESLPEYLCNALHADVWTALKAHPVGPQKSPRQEDTLKVGQWQHVTA